MSNITVVEKSGLLELRGNHSDWMVSQIKAIPGRVMTDRKNYIWAVPITRFHVWKVNGLGNVIWEERTKEIIRQKIKEKILSDRATLDGFPAEVPGLRKTAPPLFEYQKIGVMFSSTNKRVLIADDPGVGKSAQAIISSLVLDAKRTLIVCPKYLLGNWVRQLNLWTDRSYIKLGVKEINKIKKRTKTATDSILDVNFVVTNYEAIGKFEPFLDMRWDNLIVDECHLIKGNDSRRSTLIRAIKSEACMALSGTPVINRPKELFPILDLVTMGEFGTKGQFANQYCDFQLKDQFIGLKCPKCEARRKKKFEPCPNCRTHAHAEPIIVKVPDDNGASNLDELFVRLKPIMIRRTKAEVLKDLPAKMREETIIDLDDAERKEYELLMSDLEKYLKTFRKKDDMEAAKSAKVEALTRITYARQFLSGVKARYAADMAIELMRNGRNVVIFSAFRESTEKVTALITEGIKEHGINGKAFIHMGGMGELEQNAAVVDFLKASCSSFAATLDSGGVGLDLISASDAIFIDVPFEPPKLSQAEDRLHRLGQIAKVMINRLFVSDTYDVNLMEILQSKQAIIDSVMTGKNIAVDEIDIAGELIKSMIKTLREQKAAIKAERDAQAHYVA
jgi:SWI/SNF-related matrix-associated actin-dependent regulator 1 of chromatin subfamily A